MLPVTKLGYATNLAAGGTCGAIGIGLIAQHYWHMKVVSDEVFEPSWISMLACPNSRSNDARINSIIRYLNYDYRKTPNENRPSMVMTQSFREAVKQNAEILQRA